MSFKTSLANEGLVVGSGLCMQGNDQSLLLLIEALFCFLLDFTAVQEVSSGSKNVGLPRRINDYGDEPFANNKSVKLKADNLARQKLQ